VYRGHFAVTALLIVVLFALTPAARAIGPDNYGYTAAAITENFEDLTIPGVPSTAILDGTDDAAVTIPIGFPFTFYGVTYTTVSVSTNGLLTFGGADPNDYFPVSFTTSGPTSNFKTIAPLWHDWTFAYFGSDQAYYWTTGTPGNRRLIVQWDYPQSTSSASDDTVLFEVKLFEGSNNIEFHYDDTTLEGDTGESNGKGSTVGIRDVSGQVNGRNLQWEFNQSVIPDSYGIRYTSPIFGVKSITKSGTSIVLQCTGAPSKPNWIEATTDIKNVAFARISNSIIADANGNFTFTDTSPGTKKFYRVGFP